ncbi:MAG: protein kinase [Planctomycetota bacterium]
MDEPREDAPPAAPRPASEEETKTQAVPLPRWDLTPSAGAGDTTVVSAGPRPLGPVAPLPALGAELGRFLLQEVLGQGGMGVVYRAFDPSLRRAVALKLVRPELPEAVRKRFLEEAQVTAQLQHPVIIPVLEMGRTEAGQLYYTMPLVHGRSLEELLEESPGPSFRTLQVLVTVCRAVAFAHARGVLHRDLKPSNVMVGEHGEVYVLDWGLAKVIGPAAPPAPARPLSERRTLRLGDLVEALRDRDQTQAGEIVGTPVFMAPEQATGNPEDVGPAADVYCLGGILYQMLTGAPPRSGTRTAVIRALAAATTPPPPRTVRPEVSPALEAIAQRALARDPAARFPDARGLADALHDFLEGRSQGAAGGSEADREFLASYSAHDFRRPSVTVDVVLEAPLEGSPDARAVALLERRAPPFQGALALPGTFVQMEEDLAETVARVLREKAGLEDPLPPAVQAGAYGAPGRDPRTRVITIVYRVSLPRRVALQAPLRWFRVRRRAAGSPQGESHGARVAIVPLDAAPGAKPLTLAFDHAEVLADALFGATSQG